MANRYQFKTTLTGFINVFEDSGQFNNRGFKYTLPKDIIAEMEEEREGILDWCKTKAKGKFLVDFAPWERTEEGLVSYSYSNESRNPEPVFVDSTGSPIDKSVLRDLRKGTEVNMIVSHKPSMPPGKIGSKLVVHGIQIVKLATGNGALDSGALSEDEVTAMFGKVDGFTQDEPAVRELVSGTASEDSYDF
jgi:hypothetical protein